MGRGGRPRVPSGAPGGPPAGLDMWSGSRTPMAAADSSRTPAWGGALASRSEFLFGHQFQWFRANSNTAPAWGGAAASGSRTPAWKADGFRTSNPYDGNRTAYGAGGFGGGRTPAWNSGARTPYDSSSGSSGFDAFAAGSRTPAWGGTTSGGGGGRTPAWNSSGSKSYDAPTPGGEYNSAPTPGAYPSAPTPGASAPTPRWPESAPTPGALNAPTPGGFGGRPYDAPTPAVIAATPASMDDGGPRYEEGTPSP